MKKFIAIGLFLIGWVNAIVGQGIYKMGYKDLNGNVFSISSGDDPRIMEFNEDKILIHEWRGSEWELLDALDLEETDLVSTSVRIIESVGLVDTTYMLIGGESSQDGMYSIVLLIVSPGGVSAEKIALADGAEKVEHITLHQGKPLITGVFSNGPVIFNLLKRESPGQWVSIGNQLTRSLRSDYIEDIAAWKDHIFACGSFTILGKTYHLASLDNGTWKAVDYPPFIDESLTFGYYQNKLLLFGRDRGHDDLIQFFDGIQWTGMSDGLEDIVINRLDKFVSEGKDLIATGSFSQSGKNYNLIFFNGSQWRVMLPIEWADVQDASASQEGFLITLKNDMMGDYHFRKRCMIKPGEPVLYTGFYLDKNQNCSYQSMSDEVFSRGAELLNGTGMTFLTDQDGEIAIPSDGEELELQAQLPQLFHLSCNEQGKRNISADKGIFYPKRPVSFSESKPKADLWLSPNLSWSISAGEDAMFMLCVKNSGTGVLDYAELKLRFPDRFSSFTPLDPVKFVSDSLAVWEIKQLQPNEERCYRFYLRVPNDLGIDEVLQIQANLESPELDWQDVQPVEKLNLNKKIVPQGPVYKLAAQEPYMEFKPDFIDYKIVARNLSSKPVNRVTVIDTLDPQIRIDNRGIHYLTSHPAQLHTSYYIDQSGRYRYVLKWVMNQLNLADSATSPQNHSAFVDFKVNLITPDENWEICNKARVIIENLEPVQTNEICNAYRDKLTIGIKDKEPWDVFSIYPNPSSGTFSVSNGSNEHIQMKLMDAGGRMIHSFTISPKQIKEFSFRLSSGVYYIQADNGTVRQLLVH